jgi:GAF domain-containing protein
VDRQGKRVASKVATVTTAARKRTSTASELADARAQQAAVNEILRVLADAPADVTVVLNAIAKEAAQLCHAPFARVTVVQDGLLRPLAGYALDGTPRPTAKDVPLSRTSIQGRALVERKTQHFADIVPLLDEEFPDARENARNMGFRAVLAVPLMREDEALGAMFLYRREPGLFADDQVALVEAFAHQAAIALSSVAQFRATQDALEQQTATSEILRVISQSPTDVRPVFDTIAENALRLCGGIFSAVYHYDGELIHLGALRNISPEGDAAFQRAYPCKPSRSGTTQRAILTAQMVHMPDVRLDPEYGYHDVARAAGFRSVLSMPMLRNGQPIGTVTVYRDVAGAFPETKIALLRTFADQAVIAVENVRLFNELNVRNRDLSAALEQQTATSDILRVISKTPTTVQPVFDTIAESALRLCGADSAIVTTLKDDVLDLAASANASEDTAQRMRRRYPRSLGRGTATGRAILTRHVAMIPDTSVDADYDTDNATDQFRSAVAVPLLRDGEPIGAIGVGRARPGAFSERQVALLETFADQAVIAIENVRLFNEREARNRDLSEALEHQVATGDILRVIAQSPNDVQPVFDTIAASALKLCRAASALVTRRDGDMVALVASANLTEAGARAMHELFPMPVGRQSTSGRAIFEGRIVVIPDVTTDTDYGVQEHALRAAFRSTLAVPLMRDGQPIGTITVGKPEPGSFSESLVKLLQTFADQAVIAIENVRLFNELGARNRDLTEALEQQTATSDILRVMSRSQTDVQPVFDTIAHSVAELCEAEFANVFTYDGTLIHLAAAVNVNDDYVASLRKFFPRPPGRDTGVTRAIATGAVCMIEDVLEDPDYLIATASAMGGFRSVLAVPLLRDGKTIGGIAVGRPEAGPFPDSQVALLQTFADQAVIAIENVRLFNELGVRNRDLTEALEQQTATSDILRVISQSQTDVQPVFDAIVKSAVQLCGAQHSLIFELDGEMLVPVSRHVVAQEYHDYWAKNPIPPRHGTVAGTAAEQRKTIHVPDVLALPDYARPDAQKLQSYRTVLAVPMLRDQTVIGVIVTWKTQVEPFTDKQIELVETFADQAVIAIENVRLLKELNARTQDLTRSVGELRALGEVGQAVSSTLDLGNVLSTIVTRARQLSGAEGCSVYEYDDTRQEFLLHSADGIPIEIQDALRKAPMRPGEGALGQMAITGQPVEISDVIDEQVYRSHVRDRLVKHGLRSMLAVPLLRDEHLLGGLVINRRAPGAFDPQTVELMKTFASQSAIAIENARLFRELEIKSRELESASRHKSEFLANMSHELRTPLNAIIGFSEVLGERLFGDLNAKQVEYVTDIAESGRHLLDLINDILDLSKIEAGRMELDASDVDLPKTIAQTMSLVRERAERRGVALSSAIDDAIGIVRADARKVKQVLLNLLSNALKFTPEGGRIDVRAAQFDDRVEVSVTDTGIGIAPEDQDAVFEEFRQVGASAARVEGTGLGLAISRKFIELHGGRMWLASTPGKGSTFTFSLPLNPP